MIHKKEELYWFEDYFFDRFEIKIKLKYNKSKTSLNLFIKNQKFLTFSLTQNKINFNTKSQTCDYWFFEKENLNLIKKKSIPIPGVKKIKYPVVEFKSKYVKLNYDLVSFIFWTLNRLEEVKEASKDFHFRSQGIKSYAFINNYLYRPIVDEWLEIIKSLILRYDQNLKFKDHKFYLEPTHDVDITFKYLQLSFFQILKSFTADIIKRNSFKIAINRLLKTIRIKRGEIKLDPFNTYEKLISISENHQTKSIFYIHTNCSNHLYDNKQELNEKFFKKILGEIYNRGHIIGLHPSYEAYKNGKLILHEKNKLKFLLNKLNINQEIVHSRMHYLRWEQQSSLHSLQKAGLLFDGTMGYADTGGFRSGTCFPYKPFDHKNKKTSKITIKPLIMMDNTLFAKSYLSLSFSEAKNLTLNLKKECKNVNGVFSINWHNCNFLNSNYWDLYTSILNE